MSQNIRITRDVMPDHDGTDIVIRTPQGDPIGVLKFEKNTSRLEYHPGQQPHRRWPLKKKYRTR